MKTIVYIYILSVIFINASIAQSVSVSWPIDRSVFQRNGNAQASTANINIAGQYIDCATTTNPSMKYRLIPLTKTGIDGIAGSWTGISLNTRKSFNLSIGSIQTGWYRLQVSAFNGTTEIASSSVKFGVGDVYIIAGQSNARGEDGATAGTSPYDCIMAPNFNTFCPENITNFPILSNMTTSTTIAPHGQSSWCYGKMANDLIDYYNYVVPMAFFNVGNNSTTVNNWSASANGDNSQIHLDDNSYICSNQNYGTDAIYHPYRSLREVLRYYGSIYGVRAVLWHQGEFDNYKDTPISKINQTSQADYTSRLNNVISKSRSHFNSTLNWVVAKVSYMRWVDPNVTFGTNINVTNAQTSNASSGVLTTSILAGPNSDDYTNATGDRNGGVHYNQQGLGKLGAEWKNSIIANNSNFSPIIANNLPTISITKSGSTYTLTAPSGYSQYRWVYNDNNSNNYFSSSQSCSISAFQEARCYMQNSNGLWVLSQRFMGLPSGCQGARINSELIDVLPSVEVYPNPSEGYQYFEVNVKQEGPVRIELLDDNGKLVKLVTDAVHVEGVFKYAIDEESLNDGTYYLRATINGVGISKRLLINPK